MVPPFHQDTTFFFIPYYGNNDNLRKEREFSLIPSFTVHLFPSKMNPLPPNIMFSPNTPGLGVMFILKSLDFPE